MLQTMKSAEVWNPDGRMCASMLRTSDASTRGPTLWGICTPSPAKSGEHHFEAVRIAEPSAGPKNTRSASRSVMS